MRARLVNGYHHHTHGPNRERDKQYKFTLNGRTENQQESPIYYAFIYLLHLQYEQNKLTYGLCRGHGKKGE